MNVGIGTQNQVVAQAECAPERAPNNRLKSTDETLVVKFSDKLLSPSGMPIDEANFFDEDTRGFLQEYILANVAGGRPPQQILRGLTGNSFFIDIPMEESFEGWLVPCYVADYTGDLENNLTRYIALTPGGNIQPLTPLALAIAAVPLTATDYNQRIRDASDVSSPADASPDPLLDMIDRFSRNPSWHINGDIITNFVLQDTKT